MDNVHKNILLFLCTFFLNKGEFGTITITEQKKWNISEATPMPDRARLTLGYTNKRGKRNSPNSNYMEVIV